MPKTIKEKRELERELAEILRDAYHVVVKPHSAVIAPAPQPPALTVRGRGTRQARVIDQPLRDDAAWHGLKKRAESTPRRDVHVLLRTDKRKLKQTWAVFSVENPRRETSPAKLPSISYPKPEQTETSSATIDRAIARIRERARQALAEAIAGYKPATVLRLAHVPKRRKEQPTPPARPRVIRL